MRIVVHDYAGHPFQVQLSRELAARGHEVLHLYCPSHATGRGAVTPRTGDPETFSVEAVALGKPFEKYSPVARWKQERQYGRACAARIERFRPTVVLSSNTPLFAQKILQERVHHVGARFVFWQQDIHSIAVESIVRDKVPLLGPLFGRMFGRIERSLLLRSDHVVVISDDFLPVLRSWGVDERSVSVIENWAPLDELASPSGLSGWAETHGLSGRRVLLYTGTLGLKHNPGLLLALAQSVGDRDDVSVVVISEGMGANWLRARIEDEPAPGLVLLPYQPYEVLPEIMREADVLIAILEPQAGAFSVPSKVLSYLCAARPILAAIPSENLAARIIRRTGSGVVVDPTDERQFVGGAWELLNDDVERHAMGRRAREYAQRAFDVAQIASRFEGLLAGLDVGAVLPRT